MMTIGKKITKSMVLKSIYNCLYVRGNEFIMVELILLCYKIKGSNIQRITYNPVGIQEKDISILLYPPSVNGC